MNSVLEKSDILNSLSLTNGNANRLGTSDKRFHDWYRFVLSFPPHLVRHYLKEFSLDSSKKILDPFCGTGTTLLVAKANGIPNIGIEANPVTHFASIVKVNWEIDPDELITHSRKVANKALELINTTRSDKLETLPEEAMKLLITGSISPIPLHKTLILLSIINLHRNEKAHKYELLAFIKSVVLHASNLRFGPEVGVKRKKRDDALIVEGWLSEIEQMAEDLSVSSNSDIESEVILGDSRQILDYIQPNSIDAVFTSPPYPNEKDYTRTTRLESVLLGYVNNKAELRSLKKGLLRSNTRNVYKDDTDDIWIKDNPEIQRIADEIEFRRIKMNKTSGFEKQYNRVAKLYFGGMARHLSVLRKCLKPGAYLGYVVGDQASYLRVMIRTSEILADIAKSLGYSVERIDLFRKRFATVTKSYMREEVLVLRWNGKTNNR